MAITSSAIYGIIGLTVFVGLLIFPAWQGLDLEMARLASSAAVLTAILFYVNRFRFPLEVAVFHMFFAIALITVGIIAAGNGKMSPAASMIFILTALHAFHFFCITASLAIVTLIGLCFALVASHFHWPNWNLVLMLLIGCCITAGVVVHLLVRRLHQLATTDKLTGTYNRHTWDAMLSHKLAFIRRHPLPLSMMIIDLDQFKKINDSQGHQEGDRILQFTAQCIHDVLRSTDISARWGGDEFILLLHGCTLKQAHRTEKRLQQALQKTISFTAGIAEFKTGDSAESFLARADKQLLEKKKAGLRRTTDMVGQEAEDCSLVRQPQII
jgi:diguanylate cyclase (GGDEF)-like protein